MDRLKDRISFSDLQNDPRLRVLGLAAVPALFVILLAFLGGIRSFWTLMLFGVVVFAILAVTFLALPREDLTGVASKQYPKSGGREYTLSMERLGVDLFRQPTKQSLFEMFDPAVERETLLNALVYLSSNGYIIDDGFKGLLTEKENMRLRNYMVEMGFAYDSDAVYKGGWALNAAGRSIINRFLTHMLIEDD